MQINLEFFVLPLHILLKRYSKCTIELHNLNYTIARKLMVAKPKRGALENSLLVLHLQNVVHHKYYASFCRALHFSSLCFGEYVLLAIESRLTATKYQVKNAVPDTNDNT